MWGNKNHEEEIHLGTSSLRRVTWWLSELKLRVLSFKYKESQTHHFILLMGLGHLVNILSKSIHFPENYFALQLSNNFFSVHTTFLSAMHLLIDRSVFSTSLLEYISIATRSKGYKYFCDGVWTIWVYAYEWNSWVIWWCYFDFWGPCKVFSITALPPTVITFSLCTYLLQYLLSFFLMTRWVILQSSFNFHFLEDYGCWILFKTVFYSILWVVC